MSGILPFHLGFMSAACLLMIAAISIARFLKPDKRWLKLHKAVDLASLACLLVGLALAIVMVGGFGGSEAGLPHRIVGFSAIGMAAILATIGFSIFKLKGKDEVAARKRLHRWLGRVEALTMLGAALAGFVLVGII